ncbi:4'-phosphopantetheinyl transferase [Streptomyces sp. NPDC019531]|uniref:4'-phosphopantetheinyl transferase family protein n=1 Tax=Streptomyces sp. NPDC019531 TaxID=3365062 RepID=UPI00385136A6
MVIERVVSGQVVAVDSRGESDDGPVFPQEEALIAYAVEKRRREFTGARNCAREALAELSVPPTAILPGVRGAPVWPPGVVGSMTHCDGYRSAAVARTEDVRAIGIDAEPHAALPAGVRRKIVTGTAEAAQLLWLAGEFPTVHWDRLIYSAKESTYKVWSVLTGKWLGFRDALITPHPRSGTFGVRLLVPGPVVDGVTVDRFEGRWVVQDGLVVTAIVLNAPASRRRTAPRPPVHPPR